MTRLIELLFLSKNVDIVQVGESKMAETTPTSPGVNSEEYRNVLV